MFSAITSYFTGGTADAPPAPAPAPIPSWSWSRSPTHLQHAASQQSSASADVAAELGQPSASTSARLPRVVTIRTNRAPSARPARLVENGASAGHPVIVDAPQSRPTKKLPTRERCSGTDTDDEDYQGLRPNTPPYSNMIVPDKYDLSAYLKGAILPRLWGRHPETGENVAVLGRKERSGKNELELPEEETGGINVITRVAKTLFREMVDYYYASAITRFFVLSDHERILKGPESRIVEALTLPTFVEEGVIRPEKRMPELTNASTINDVVEWLVEGPLKTAQRATHLTDFLTRQWGFEPLESNDDHQRVFVWQYHPETLEDLQKAVEMGKDHFSQIEYWAVYKAPLKDPSNPVSLAVFVQPPWILGLGDLEDFVKFKELPELSSISNKESLSAAQRLWYSVLDTCKELDIASFIVTSYEGWVYGTFASDSETTCDIPPSMMEVGATFNYDQVCAAAFEHVIYPSWSRCAVSSVYKYNASSPSTLQSLTYWIAQSMGLRFTDVIQSAIAPNYLYRSHTIQINDALPESFENALRSQTENTTHPSNLGYTRFGSGWDPASLPSRFKSAYPEDMKKVWPNFRPSRVVSKRASASSSQRYAPYSPSSVKARRGSRWSSPSA